jgi:hypothetical protein
VKDGTPHIAIATQPWEGEEERERRDRVAVYVWRMRGR